MKDNSGFKGLIVYKKAYDAAMTIFEISKSFPKEEMYSLTDQMRRSSRSVCANIAEAYRKRRYVKSFRSKLSDSDAECAETMVHLDFSRDCGYLREEKYEGLIDQYQQVGKILNSIIINPGKFLLPLPTATAAS